MLREYSFGACLPTFGNCADRYCQSGYKRDFTMDEMLDRSLEVGAIDGLELVGNWHVNDDNIREVTAKFKDRNLKVPMLVPDLWTQAKWGMGSLASADPATRRAAVDEVRKVMDWAAELDCPFVDVWPGQDGFDYPFQVDYITAWQWLREGIAACAEHNDRVKVLVEYKLKEPRRHLYVDSAARTLMLIQDIPNTGVLLDVGHAMAAGENIAEAAAFLSAHGKLDYLHLNDNYRSWDDDMIFGSVNLIEDLELVYWLKRMKYSGWLTLDIFPFRIDGVRAAKECYANLAGLFNAIDRVGMERMNGVIEAGDPVVAAQVIREAFAMQS